jgi:lambda repressor-like predicted transcriptional regulator
MSIPVMREEVVQVVHVEDVKAALRKRYGTLEVAQRKMGLKGSQPLRDYLAGKSMASHAVVARELGYEPEHLRLISGIFPKCGEESGEAAERAA